MAIVREDEIPYITHSPNEIHIDDWNSLDDVTVTSQTLGSFKTCLHNHVTRWEKHVLNEPKV